MHGRLNKLTRRRRLGVRLVSSARVAFSTKATSPLPTRSLGSSLGVLLIKASDAHVVPSTDETQQVAGVRQPELHLQEGGQQPLNLHVRLWRRLRAWLAASASRATYTRYPKGAAIVAVAVTTVVITDATRPLTAAASILVTGAAAVGRQAKRSLQL